MAHISKHYAKQKWECNAGENCRVDFFVCWNTIRVNNLLVNLSKLVSFEICWRLYFFKRNFLNMKFELTRRVRRYVDNPLFRLRTIKRFQKQWFRQRRPKVAITNRSMTSKLIQLCINRFFMLNKLKLQDCQGYIRICW